MKDAAWSQPVRLAEVGRGSLRRTLVPSEAERERIARELNLVKLPELSAEVDMTSWMDGAVLRGRWRARVVQTCGVTLDPFETPLSGEFEVKVVPQGSPVAPTEEGAVELDLEAEDPPDVLADDRIDTAGYVVEHLALELDPFPRKPGAEFEAPEPEPETSPFAALLQLKPRS
ncbi:MAG: DUF177 domain-containing protein [Proteobacteria bacterium]|nr:DUF177 domain-containing protein [Pseudomonadota bacterium]